MRKLHNFKYTGLFIIPRHVKKNCTLQRRKRIVTCDIPIERQSLQVYFAYLINALCVALCDTADVKPIIRFRPYPPQNVGLLRFTIHRHPSRCDCSYHCFMLFFTGGSFPKLARKRRCNVTIDCLQAHSQKQNTFSARVAIFTQPAPLVATDVTKHPRHVQTNKVFLSACLLLPSFAPFKRPDFLLCLEIMNNCVCVCVHIYIYIY
jgi:hypothetical protein